MPAISGRPDGRLSKYIYADGQGGVCRDMRYSANGVDTVNFAEADQRVKNGTYRGFEKRVFTRVYTLPIVTVGSYIGGYNITSNIGDFRGIVDKRYSMFYNATRNVVGYIALVEEQYLYLSLSPICRNLPNIADTDSGMTIEPYVGTQVGDTVYLIAGVESNSSIGGSFLQTDVIGNPANILATPALANGWQGSWGGIAEAGGVNKVGTRKNINGGELTYSVDNGVSWGKGTFTPNSENNVTSTYSDSDIRICQYQAFATQTENAVNRGVYGTFSGIGNVFIVSNHYKAAGGLLAESAAGLVLKSNFGVTRNFKTILTNALGGDNEPQSAGGHDGITHTPLTIGAPTNNSHAFKALNYDVNINQQAFIQYAYTELKHNGTNWGDDGTVTIVDNQSTKTDLNGNTVLVGTAKLKEPIGWIKQKI